MPPDLDYEVQVVEGLISYYEAHRDYILWRHNLIARTFGQARRRYLDIGSGGGRWLQRARTRRRFGRVYGTIGVGLAR